MTTPPHLPYTFHKAESKFHKAETVKMPAAREDRSKPLLGRTYDDVHSELLHPPHGASPARAPRRGQSSRLRRR
ncbi:Putative hydroxypyruvate isomerase (fragment) [Arthrobacter sp. 8AJ]